MDKTNAPATRKALLIPVEGPIRQVTIGDDALGDLQAIVGGWIEAVPLPEHIPDADRGTAYINEEGKLNRLPVNSRATSLLLPGVGIMFGDYIAGPMVLCGFDPETGDNADVPAGIVNHLALKDRASVADGVGEQPACNH